MTRREKVLLGIMGGAVLVVAGFYALGGRGRTPDVASKGGPDKTLAAAQKGAEAQLKAVRAAGATDMQALVVDMALRPWNAAAFYDKPLDLTPSSKGEGYLPSFTGYVELGALHLAIIDGYEYREGDELETGGFLVEEIKPSQVTLRMIDTGKLLRLPYQDPSFFTQ